KADPLLGKAPSGRKPRNGFVTTCDPSGTERCLGLVPASVTRGPERYSCGLFALQNCRLHQRHGGPHCCDMLGATLKKSSWFTNNFPARSDKYTERNFFCSMNLRSYRKALRISQTRLAHISGVGRFKICLSEIGDG